MCMKPLCRRGLLAGVLGASLLPGAARAQEQNVTALAITCIDYRLVEEASRFFAARNLTRDYDLVSLAGASLAAVSGRFPSSNAAFWDHVGIARQLHNIRKVIVLDHRDCGAYRVAFGDAVAGESELARHREVMVQARARLSELHPGLDSEFYLMALDGQAERIL